MYSGVVCEDTRLHGEATNVEKLTTRRKVTSFSAIARVAAFRGVHAWKEPGAKPD